MDIRKYIALPQRPSLEIKIDWKDDQRPLPMLLREAPTIEAKQILNR
jgi:hypothetical protein